MCFTYKCLKMFAICISLDNSSNYISLKIRIKNSPAVSVQFSHSVKSNSLPPHRLQHARLPCPSPTPRAAHTHVHWVSEAIQPSHLLSSPSPPAFTLSQHQGLFKWVSPSHCCAQCQTPLSGKREGLQDNATGKKGKFITDSSQGPLPHPTQGCRSESPEPKLLHKFIGWAHAIGLSGLVTSLQGNFIGQNFCSGGTFLGVSAPFLIS